MADFPGFRAAEQGGALPVAIPGRSAAPFSPSVPNPDREVVLLPGNAVTGASAVGTPVAPASIDVPGICGKSVGEDWIDRIHVLPRRIDFGNILGTVNRNVEIFSSFQFIDVSFTTFINNVGQGVSFTNLPALPLTITPLSGIELDLEVTTDGTPNFDDTLDFIFDVSSASLPLTGSRVTMFPYQWQSGSVETLSFLTDVIEHNDGSEQRIALRKSPRQSINALFLREEGTKRSRIDFLLFDWQARVFGLPMRHELMTLTAAASVTDLTINVDSTALVDLRVGGLAIVVADDEVTFDSLEVSSFDATSITFSSGLQFAYPAGTTVFAVRTCTIQDNITGARFRKGLGSFQIKFDVIDNDNDLASTAAFNSLDSLVYLDGINFMSGATLRETYQRRFERFESRAGAFAVDSPWTRNRRGSSKTFLTKSRQELWDVRRLLHALRGRQVPFFIPTFYEEMRPTVLLTNGADTITIENVGWTRFVQDRSPKNRIRVVETDGTILIRTVTGSSEIDRFTEQLTVDSSWPANIQVNEIDKIDIIEKVRIDNDVIKIDHQDSNGNARISFPVKVIF